MEKRQEKNYLVFDFDELSINSSKNNCYGCDEATGGCDMDNGGGTCDTDTGLSG